jgi:hypothetical protein
MGWLVECLISVDGGGDFLRGLKYEVRGTEYRVWRINLRDRRLGG